MISGNFCSRGTHLEQQVSSDFHKHGVPLLVDPLFLRRRNSGQIDLARMEKRKGQWIGELVEIKSSHLPGRRQIGRLKKSGTILSHLFNIPFVVTGCVSLPKLKWAL